MTRLTNIALYNCFIRVGKQSANLCSMVWKGSNEPDQDL